MMRTWKRLALAVTLIGALSVSAAGLRADGVDEQPTPKPDKLDDIQKQLDKINDSLKKQFLELNIGLGKSFEEVQKDIMKLQKELKSVKDDKTLQEMKLDSLNNKLKEFEDSIVKLQGDVGFLSKKVSDVKLYPPVDKSELVDIRYKLEQLEKMLQQIKGGPYVAKFPPSGSGKIVLVNNTAEEITVLINNMSYRVAPFSAYPLEGQPAGLFSYEVLSPTFGVLRKNTTSLNANETFTIRIG